MHRSLYLSPDKLEDRHLRHYAHAIGLDVERFDQDMATHSYVEKIMNDYYHSINNGVTGAPTTFVNGVLYAKTDVDLIDAVRAQITPKSSSR